MSDLRNPGNTQRYEKLWAILSVDGKGNEGIVGINTPFGPQVAVTGEQRVLDLYLAQVTSPEAVKEMEGASLRLVIAEFNRSTTKELNK